MSSADLNAEKRALNYWEFFGSVYDWYIKLFREHIPTVYSNKVKGVFEMTRSVWSVLVNVRSEVCDGYTNLLRYTNRYKTFFVIQTVWVYTRSYGDIGISVGIRTEMAIFHWYTSFIRLCRISIATFFFAVFSCSEEYHSKITNDNKARQRARKNK